MPIAAFAERYLAKDAARSALLMLLTTRPDAIPPPLPPASAAVRRHAASAMLLMPLPCRRLSPRRLRAATIPQQISSMR